MKHIKMKYVSSQRDYMGRSIVTEAYAAVQDSEFAEVMKKGQEMAYEMLQIPGAFFDFVSDEQKRKGQKIVAMLTGKVAIQDPAQPEEKKEPKKPEKKEVKTTFFPNKVCLNLWWDQDCVRLFLLLNSDTTEVMRKAKEAGFTVTVDADVMDDRSKEEVAKAHIIFNTLMQVEENDQDFDEAAT